MSKPVTKGVIYWAFVALGAWAAMIASLICLEGLASDALIAISLCMLILAVVLFLSHAFPLEADKE